MQFSTRAIHTGQAADPSTGAVTPPIHLSSIYEFSEPGVSKAGYEYIRHGSPNRHSLEMCLASLEGAPEECPALCYSSGMAAIDAAMRLLHPGEKLLLARDIYGGTISLAEKLLRPNGIHVEYGDTSDIEKFSNAITANTRMVWIETPSNPLLTLTDIAAVSRAAHSVGALAAADNTFATPYLQNPLALGVDIVMHSTTKYLGGHSDLLGGALVVNDPSLYSQLLTLQKMTGAVASPFDCWLTLRGIRTLSIRMQKHCENAASIARFLQTLPQVRKVHYPGLEEQPLFHLAQRQMRGFGGIVSMEVDPDRAQRILRKTKIFTLAGSLGGVESIISYPRLMSHSSLSEEERQERGITDGLIRLSIGLEDTADLIADLEQALED